MNISIIIPVYKVEKYIERCLHSIINQTFTNGVECIIVNDCTPDNSIRIAENIIRNYQGNISFKIIHHLTNQGIAITRDTGLQNASGKYITYIDSDDYCNPDMLNDMYKKAEEEHADIVVADFFITYSKGEFYKSQPPLCKEDCIKQMLEGKFSPAVWNKLVRREILVNNQIENIKGGDNGEDYYMMIRAFHYAEKIVFLNKAFVHYVQYNAHSYTASTGEKRIQSHLLITEVVKNFLIENNIFDKYKESFFIGVANLKPLLLANSSGKRQKELNKLYPESRKTKIIMSTRQKLPTKIAMLFASHNLLFVYNFYHKIRLIYQK